MICDQVPVKVRIIPGLNEILDGSVEISRIRDVQIQDLLGREKIELDVELISSEMTGKTVMVTGAGGSIGAELARQVLRFKPATLLLVERAEFALFDVDHKLKLAHPDLSIRPLVADVGNVERMRFIFDSYRPQVIIHAAAHKHVPLMEFNVTEAMRNNVTATYLLGELAGEYGAEVFTLVSTDKAVRPTSIMGASKRFAELVVQDLNSRFETRFVAVRFGNVIGSSGSVIPIFLDQIRRGGPVTLTDRRMKRYFMTIPEAAQLVLQASALGKGGEVFILQMGEPILIKDLAETLIRLSGLKPHEDIEIVETGLRPGEKLCEELRFESEETDATEHSKIFINKIATFDQKAIESALERINELLLSSDEKALIKLLSELVPEARLNGYLAKPQAQVAQSGK
jgi:FlaA1/EpsC-like NDP-sugar epimerase